MKVSISTSTRNNLQILNPSLLLPPAFTRDIAQQDLAYLETNGREISDRIEAILGVARVLPTIDSDEGEKLRETISSSSLPTFQTATRTITAGKGGSFAIDGLKSSLQSLHSKVETLVFLLSHSLEAKIVLEDASSFSHTNLTVRKDLVFSHSLVALLSIFTSNINRRINDEMFLQQLATIGYMAQFER